MSGRTPITAIAAVAENGVIGADNAIPWKLDGDFARLKKLTMGGVLVMGRRTFESIGRPLPGRDSFVVTRNPVWSAAGTTVFDDVDAALDAAVATGKQVWVFGGGEIYRATWGRTQALEITHVHAEHAGDAHFPEIDPADWQETAREDRPGFSWVRYERR
ncbi:dihydrofolate reductase [Ammonicoccus fulvus]|uniref:Dihydrofolate reductase n=1 Tax=Ammonicoccus fulvus TaxID=3138240 RepID=A0ABZ3FQ06_9ACTN